MAKTPAESRECADGKGNSVYIRIRGETYEAKRHRRYALNMRKGGRDNMPDDRKITQFFGSREPKSENGKPSKPGNGGIETGGKKGSLLNAMLGVKSGEPKGSDPKDEPKGLKLEEKQPKRGLLAELTHRMSGAQSPKPPTDEVDGAKGGKAETGVEIAQQPSTQPVQQKGFGSPRSPFPMPTRRGGSRSRIGAAIGQAAGAAAIAAAGQQQAADGGYRWDTGADPDEPIEMSGFYVLSENAVILAEWISTLDVEARPLEFSEVIGVVKSFHPEIKTPYEALDYIYDYPDCDDTLFEMMRGDFDDTEDKDIVAVANGLEYTFESQEDVAEYLRNRGNAGVPLDDAGIEEVIGQLGEDHIYDFDPDAFDRQYGMGGIYDHGLPNADDSIDREWFDDMVAAIDSGDVPAEVVVSSLADPSSVGDRDLIGCRNPLVPEHIIAWCPFIRAGKTMNDCPVHRDSATMCPVEMDLDPSDIAQCYGTVDYLLM